MKADLDALYANQYTFEPLNFFKCAAEQNHVEYVKKLFERETCKKKRIKILKCNHYLGIRLAMIKNCKQVVDYIAKENLQGKSIYVDQAFGNQ